MIGDRVKVQFNQLNAGTTPIPIYQLKKDPITGHPFIDETDGCYYPIFIGGVNPGSYGTIKNGPVKVIKQKLQGVEKHATLGVEHVPLYEVYFDHYKQTAWVFNDNMIIIGSDPSLNY